MIEHVVDTGDRGRLKIEDFTDDPGDMTVSLWIQSLSPVLVPNLPWTYSLGSNKSKWKYFYFQDTTVWQKLTSVYVGDTVETFTLHLGDTGTSQLNGPTDHQVSLAGYVEPPPSPTGPSGTNQIYVRIDGQWKLVTPYVHDGGSWKAAQPFVRTDQGWKE